MSARSLVIGLGSPHGDDRAGWEIARRVEQRLPAEVSAQYARSPAEMLNWLEGASSLDICDALVSDDAIGSLHCWRWPASEIECGMSRMGHDLSLTETLALADHLGCLPQVVRIWGMGVLSAARLEGLSPQVESAMPAAVERICRVIAVEKDKS